MCQEGAEDMPRQNWSNTFSAMDINQDGVTSKIEHYRFFEAWKTVKDLIHAAVTFAAIDIHRDGVITQDEYVNAVWRTCSISLMKQNPVSIFADPL